MLNKSHGLYPLVDFHPFHLTKQFPISSLKSGWKMKKIFCCPALELFHCLPLWKTVLFVSSRAFSLSTPVENSEATWKKATKCNKVRILTPLITFALPSILVCVNIFAGNTQFLWFLSTCMNKECKWGIHLILSTTVLNWLIILRFALPSNIAILELHAWFFFQMQ